MVENIIFVVVSYIILTLFSASALFLSSIYNMLVNDVNLNDASIKFRNVYIKLHNFILVIILIIIISMYV